MELAGLTIHALHNKLISGEASATALTEAVLTRLAAVEERVHAYITVTPDPAQQQAAAADEAFARAEDTLTPARDPVGHQGHICTRGAYHLRLALLANFTRLMMHGDPAPAQRRGGVRWQGQHG